MDQYVTGALIRRLRDEKGLTQEELAARLRVTGKAVSKWETGRGYPDVSLLEPLSDVLGVSVMELMSGRDVRNRNRTFNMRRSVFYLCPVCGNAIFACGEAVVSCCGVTLLPAEAEPMDEAHRLSVEPVEDELYVTMHHEMTKTHYISFLAALTDAGIELVRLYPEGSCEARFKRRGLRDLYACCRRDGLFRLPISRI